MTTKRKTDAHVQEENPFNSLKRIFHEPSRLSIVSALCSAPNGLTFKALKDDCDLTDGNLSRHLRMLEEDDVVEIRKAFVSHRPLTTVFLAETGRQRFIDYLEALEEVLKLAEDALEQPETPDSLQDLSTVHA